MEKIVFRHLSGSRGNQVDSFPSGDYELIVGRDPAAHIHFDQDRDDLVSRQHVKIIKDPWDPNGYQVVDLQSRNGTFLNKQRVFGSARLNHNDVIQLGAGGPEFRFELDPPPEASGAAPATRLGVAATPGVKATRESWVPDPQGKPAPVGRATVERMLGDVFTRVKRQSNRTVWIVGVAALAGIILLGAGVYTVLRKSQTQMQSNMAEAQQKNEQNLAAVQEELKKAPAALDEAKEQVRRLEEEVRAATRRSEANQQELMNALQDARKRAAAAQAAATEAARRQASLELALRQEQERSSQQNRVQVTAAVPYDELRRLAETRIEQGQVGQAKDLANQLMQADSKRWEGYAIAGRIASLEGNFRAATDMFQSALDRAPADVRPTLEKQWEAARGLVPK